MIHESIDVKKMNFSFFGKGAVLSGVFRLKGITHLNSRLDGEITMEDKGRLIIEDEGIFTGSFRGHDIDIFGTVDATLVATGKVTIHSTARVSGNIRANEIVVNPNSHVNMKADTNERLDREISY